MIQNGHSVSSKAESACRVVRLAKVAHNRLKRKGDSLYLGVNKRLKKKCFEIPFPHQVVWQFQKSNPSTTACPGMSDPLLAKMAKCGKSKLDSHICQNLHATARKFGKVLPVKISRVPTMYRLSRRKPKRVKCKYPVLFLSDWAECILDMGGWSLLLGWKKP